MNKKIKKIIYYSFIIIMFFITDKIIYLLPNKNGYNNIVNNTCLMENNDLKNKLQEISKIDYHDYDYEIGKITFKELYNNNSYYIEYNSTYNDNVVLNDKGMIGIVNNHILKLVKDLSLGVKINDNYGTLKNGKVSIVTGDYEVGMPIYTSGITSINDNYLLGYVSNIENNDYESILDIKYLNITSDYVVILK